MRRAISLFLRASVAMAAIAAGAAVMDCAGEQPEIKYARGYVRGPHRVSVLGVFKDGRMDTAAWDQLGPKVADALDGPCEPGYGEHLRSAEPRLFQSIEEQAEQDGVTPTLLDQLAGRTDAELILVLYEYGAPPRPAGSSSAAAPKPPAPASTPSLRGRGRGSRGGRRAGGGSPPRGAAPEADFELAASLFDVNEHAFVAEVDVKKAKTADAAIDQLVNSFDSLLSGSSCAIFDWDKQ